MVKEKNIKEKQVFQCMKCGYYYKTKESAEECEDWCKQHSSCNLLITRNAIKLK